MHLVVLEISLYSNWSDFFTLVLILFSINFFELFGNIFLNKILPYLVTVVFTADIWFNFVSNSTIFRFNSSSFDCQIPKKYKKFTFLIDVLAAFPFFLLKTSDDQSAEYLILGFKMTRITEFFNVLSSLKLYKFLFYMRQINALRIYPLKKSSKRFILNVIMFWLMIMLGFLAFYALPVYMIAKFWVTDRQFEEQLAIEQYLSMLHSVFRSKYSVGFGEKYLA